MPKLAGVERQIELRFGDPTAQIVVRSQLDSEHEKQLTRDSVTASVHYVHYVHFSLTTEQVARFDEGPVVLAVTHPAYAHSTELAPETVAQLRSDLRNGA